VLDPITAGRILIRQGTGLPEAVRLESDPYASGWRLLKNLDGYELGKKIHEAKWTFFCQAGGIKSLAFGFDRQETVRRAISQILAKLKSTEFNSLEIRDVANKRFLGMPYVSVSARSRHIQESPFLFRAKKVQKWESSLRAAA
jgi:hypothetical protein